MSNALAKKEGTEVALNDEYLNLVNQDAGAGLEAMTVEDFAIPRIGIIQSLSPQRNKQKPEFIEGCSEGQIFESVTKKLWDGGEGIHVVPVKFNRSYIEWKPRGEGAGGIVKNHGADRTAFDNARVDEKGKRWTPEGNTIQLHAEYFVLVMAPNKPPIRAIISFSGTFLRQAKAWNNLIAESKLLGKDGKYIDTPAFFNVYQLKTTPVSNAKGSWFVWSVQNFKNVFDYAGNDGLYKMAKEFLQGIEAGKVKVSDPVADHEGDAGEEDDASPM